MGYGRERGNMAIKKSIPEKIFSIFNTLFMILIMIIMLYPVWYCLVCSISRPSLLMSHRGLLLLPLGFNIASYKAIISYQSLWIGYTNTIFYVIAGTALNIIMTTLAAYSLSRKNVMFATAVTFMITFTMFFGGGLIPSYLNIQRLGLLNTRLALLLPGAMSAYNFIIMRTSFKEVPESLEESARIDGAQDFTILFRIMIPLCKYDSTGLGRYHKAGFPTELALSVPFTSNPNYNLPSEILRRNAFLCSGWVRPEGGIQYLSELSYGLNHELIYNCISADRVSFTIKYSGDVFKGVSGVEETYTLDEEGVKISVKLINPLVNKIYYHLPLFITNGKDRSILNYYENSAISPVTDPMLIPIPCTRTFLQYGLSSYWLYRLSLWGLQ
jgi:ABC-type glycerol-3-phosphate transport system permease component